jgi:hypothetical protein
VLFHVGLLIKPLVAVLEFAEKRLFLCVNSQMVEKVMPLTENFATIFMRAAE